VGQLDYLACSSVALPESPTTGSLEFEAYRADQQTRLARVVESTYSDTMDCPELNGLRDTRDVLDGYRHANQFRPDCWWFVLHRKEDIGCLLLAEHAEHNQIELVYMGLVPWVRGHGWGRILVRHAQWMCRQLGRARVVLAVDSRNEPALEIYSSAGFLICDQRQLLIKTLRGRFR
jgi:ribosomal protein S18 acetylase RimI-like enzyme